MAFDQRVWARNALEAVGYRYVSFYDWFMNPVVCVDGEWRVIHLKPEDFDNITVGMIDASVIRTVAGVPSRE